MSTRTPDTVPESSAELSLDDQYKMILELLEQGTQVPNICTVTKNTNGKYHVVIESFVIELEEGVINSNARVVPYKIEIDNIDYTPISFYYNKPDNASEVDFTKNQTTQEHNERVVLPIVRIKANPGTTLVRPNHIYYSGDGAKMGVSEAIISLNIEGDQVTNKNRYFPIDCAPGLLSNIANSDPRNLCILRTFSLSKIEKMVDDLAIKTAGVVNTIQNPLS